MSLSPSLPPNTPLRQSPIRIYNVEYMALFQVSSWIDRAGLAAWGFFFFFFFEAAPLLLSKMNSVSIQKLLSLYFPTGFCASSSSVKNIQVGMKYWKVFSLLNRNFSVFTFSVMTFSNLVFLLSIVLSVGDIFRISWAKLKHFEDCRIQRSINCFKNLQGLNSTY